MTCKKKKKKKKKKSNLYSYTDTACFILCTKSKRVYSTKFLGVFLDDKLSWNHHVDYLCKTISKNIGILYKLQFLPQNIFKMLYHSLVSSHKNSVILFGGSLQRKILNGFINYRNVAFA